MKQIAVYTAPEVIEHKQRDGRESDGSYCFWRFGRVPELIRSRVHYRIGDEPAPAPGFDFAPDEVGLDEEIRLYFATKGAIKGYFVCNATSPDMKELWFFSETWRPIAPIPQRPFQGFKYFEGAA